MTLATVSKELGRPEIGLWARDAVGVVSTTPFRGIALNQEGEARMRWLTDDEEARLVASRRALAARSHPGGTRHRTAPE